MQRTVLLSQFCLSVRPSVCQMRVLWQNYMMYCGYFDTARKGNHSSFLTPTVVGGRRPFPLKFALKVTYPSKKCRLRQISAYNVSTVSDSEKIQLWRIGNRQRAFQRWGAYVMPCSQNKVTQKPIFCCLNKIQFQSNKVCYKVSLCENFQWQSCSITILQLCRWKFPVKVSHLMVHRYWRET